MSSLSCFLIVEATSLQPFPLRYAIPQGTIISFITPRNSSNIVDHQSSIIFSSNIINQERGRLRNGSKKRATKRDVYRHWYSGAN